MSFTRFTTALLASVVCLSGCRLDMGSDGAAPATEQPSAEVVRTCYYDTCDEAQASCDDGCSSCLNACYDANYYGAYLDCGASCGGSCGGGCNAGCDKGSAACYDPHYELNIYDSGDRDVLDACFDALGHARQCGQSIRDWMDCSLASRVRPHEAVAEYGCMASTPCGAEPKCPGPTPREHDETLCGMAVTCGSDCKIPNWIYSGNLREDVVAAAERCADRADCSEFMPCLEALRVTMP